MSYLEFRGQCPRCNADVSAQDKHLLCLWSDSSGFTSQEDVGSEVDHYYTLPEFELPMPYSQKACDCPEILTAHFIGKVFQGFRHIDVSMEEAEKIIDDLDENHRDNSELLLQLEMEDRERAEWDKNHSDGNPGE